MNMSDERMAEFVDNVVDEVTAEVISTFQTFGGGQVDDNSPIAKALAGRPPMFAMGVDVRNVVIMVIAKSIKSIADFMVQETKKETDNAA